MSEDQKPPTLTLYPRINGELILRTDDGQEINLGRTTFHADMAVAITTPDARITYQWADDS